jgi:hypothetical protein
MSFQGVTRSAGPKHLRWGLVFGNPGCHLHLARRPADLRARLSTGFALFVSGRIMGIAQKAPKSREYPYGSAEVPSDAFASGPNDPVPWRPPDAFRGPSDASGQR